VVSFKEEIEQELDVQDQCAKAIFELPEGDRGRVVRWLVMAFILHDEFELRRLLKEIQVLCKE